MVIQDRISHIGLVHEKSFTNVNPSFGRALERRSVAREDRQQATRSYRTWLPYALMVVGAGCFVAAFMQDTQAHPWWPLLLGWAGTMAVIRGFMGKVSSKA